MNPWWVGLIIVGYFVGGLASSRLAIRNFVGSDEGLENATLIGLLFFAFWPLAVPGVLLMFWFDNSVSRDDE